MRRIALTGVSGFIGREMPVLLRANGFEVHCLGRGSAPEGCIGHRIDLLNGDPTPVIAKIGATHLLHLAWFAEPGLFWNAPENLDWVAASLRLVRAFARSGGERAVFAGSCAEYDWSSAVLDEATTPLAPATLYGESKAALFRIIEKATPELNLSVAWGRIFFPYGPFEKPGRLLSMLFDGVACGDSVAFSAGTQQRDFMHADDVAAAFVALLESSACGAVNVASGETIAVRAIVERAAEIAGASGLITFGTRPLQPGEPPLMAAATSRLRDEVGFTPRHSIDTGLSDMFRRRPAPLKQEKI